jgi:hypothetical protein
MSRGGAILHNGQAGSKLHRRGWRTPHWPPFCLDTPGSDCFPDTAAMSRPKEDMAKETHAPSGHRPLDFSTYLMSLGAAAMVQLGEAPDPSGNTAADLEGARQTIDLLAILETKTAGNLEPPEQRLLQHLVRDLRGRFIAVTGR